MALAYHAPNFRGSFPGAVAGWFQRGQVGRIVSSVASYTIPIYYLWWMPNQNVFTVNEQPAIEWMITRKDTLNVPLPTMATITITRPDGGIDTFPSGQVFIGSTVPAPSITLGVTYPITMAGAYVATLTVTLATGSGPAQVRKASIVFTAIA